MAVNNQKGEGRYALNVYLLKIMCLNPKQIRKQGNYKENNYRGQAGDPYSIVTYADCCACTQCQAKRSNNWVIRNWYEAKQHEKKCFITLTYAKQPFFLVRKDMQDFLKRFRYEINKDYFEGLKKYKKSIKNDEFFEEKIETWKIENADKLTKIRFFYCGEYGSKHGRPHFHIIIYGWEDPKAYFIGINKKINVIYQSEIIEKTWGLGRTTYQSFGDFEATYISLYSTPKEAFAKAYKMTREKVKQIRDIVEKKLDYYGKGQRVNIINALNEYEKKLNEQKKKYMLIKEFNGWSISVGWEEFIKEYTKNNEYTYTEYIYDREFATPSSWLKKLANQYGDIDAANELFKREKDLYKSANETEERARNRARENAKKTKEILDWQTDGKNIETDDF